MASESPAKKSKTVSTEDDNTIILIKAATKLFESEFGSSPRIAAFAPGRVNLIGEHTDYTGGFVLPIALEKKCVIVGIGSIVDITDDDSDCMVVSVGIDGGAVTFNADPSVLAPSEEKTSSWTNYIRGVVKQYSNDLPQNKKFSFKVAYNSDVPLGSGLSSSAALEVVTATFLEQLPGVVVPSKETKAVRCQSAEHEFCNMPCGIMDQFISSLGATGHALLIDCRTNVGTKVKMTSDEMVILVTNSNVKHQLTGSEYPTRVKQCQEATACIAKKHSSVKQLRDADLSMLLHVRDDMDEIVFKRARHVISENDRVMQTVKALESGDFKQAGTCMLASHESLRDDFEVSCPELDILVEIAKKHPDVFGTRMTGGGFGGCTVTLVLAKSADELIELLKKEYFAATKLNADCFITRPGNGASEVPMA